jgi:hypothetical protein
LITPRTNIRQIKAMQARRDAVHQNKAHEAEMVTPNPIGMREKLGLKSKKPKKEEEKKEMGPPRIDIDLEEVCNEYIDPNMKKYDIKAQKMDTVTKIMNIEWQLKCEDF